MKILAHHDADGITSAFIYLKTHDDVEKVIFPEEFGDTTEWESGDVMVDMRPTDPTIEGTVYDHHAGHSEERNYELFFGHYPASRVVYDEFGSLLDDDDKWKVVVGIAGDQEAEHTPLEIWEKYPYLLDTDYYETPLYERLPSTINCFCRVGEYQKALKKLDEAITPYDLLRDPESIAYRKALQNEVKAIRNKFKVQHFRHVTFWEYESSMRVTGYLAAILQGSKRNTVVVYDRVKHAGSARGVLCPLLEAKLVKYGITIGGHSVAKGFSIENEEQYDKLIEVMKSV